MRAFLIYTGNGPILTLTTYAAINDPRLLDKLRYKGISKFIGYEVPLPIVRQRYEHSFPAIAADLQAIEDVRVLDFNGHQIMANFSLSELGEPITIEG